MRSGGVGNCLRAAQLLLERRASARTTPGCRVSYVGGSPQSVGHTYFTCSSTPSTSSWLLQQQRRFADKPAEGDAATPDSGGTSSTPPNEAAGGSGQGDVARATDMSGTIRDSNGNEGGNALAQPGVEDINAIVAPTFGRTKTKWDTAQMLFGPKEREPRPSGHKRGRKLTRAQKGSYDDPQFLEQLAEISNDVPPNVPLYDIQTTFPYFFEPNSRPLELLQWAEKNAPELLEGLGDDTEEAEPYPGARRILRWETNLVLTTGNFNHPMNKKVRCWVYLRDLQEECGLTDEAIRHIALVAGPRYNPNKGELKLVTEKYPSSEENRQHIMVLLNRLIEEGERKYPGPAREGQEAGQEAANAA